MYFSTPSVEFSPTERTATLRLNSTGVPFERNACWSRPFARAAKNTGVTLGVVLNVARIIPSLVSRSKNRSPSVSHAAISAPHASLFSARKFPFDDQPHQVYRNA